MGIVEKKIIPFVNWLREVCAVQYAPWTSPKYWNETTRYCLGLEYASEMLNKGHQEPSFYMLSFLMGLEPFNRLAQKEKTRDL